MFFFFLRLRFIHLWKFQRLNLILRYADKTLKGSKERYPVTMAKQSEIGTTFSFLKFALFNSAFFCELQCSVDRFRWMHTVDRIDWSHLFINVYSFHICQMSFKPSSNFYLMIGLIYLKSWAFDHFKGGWKFRGFYLLFFFWGTKRDAFYGDSQLVTSYLI